jgi:hypothetical protein
MFTALITFITASVTASAFTTELLKCKLEAVKAKPAVGVIREAAENANLSDHEVVSRLILSEALSTGYWNKRCDAPNAQALMEAIGWVILNRAQKLSPKRDDPMPTAFYDAVFAKPPFDSLSNKADNPFLISFLCPWKPSLYLEKVKSVQTHDALYKMAKGVASRQLEIYQTKGIPAANARIVNVYYPHSELAGITRPKWAKNEDPTKNKGYQNLLGGEKPCAEFYRR